MANNNSTMPGIKRSWTLLAFADGKRMQVAPFTNSETGETFKSCVFTDNITGQRQLCAFSSKIGELTPSEIVSMKTSLQVVELESGNLKLCKQGQDTWEEVCL